MLRLALSSIAALVLASCGAGSGELTLPSYNVAGLPQGLSKSNPERNIPLISPLLNRWSLDERFVDDDGEPLSDHEAVAVRLTWEAL